MNATKFMNRANDASAKLSAMVMAKKEWLMGGLASAMGANAHAQSAGWIGTFRNLTQLGREGATLVTVGFFVGGLCAIGYGGKLLWDKSNDRGDDIKMAKIGWCFAGGTVMCAIGFFAAMSVVTAGGSESDMGRRINIQ